MGNSSYGNGFQVKMHRMRASGDAAKKTGGEKYKRFVFH